MKIVLLENLRKLGSIGEIINVKRGYARNFLIPEKKALFASEKNIAEVEKIKSELNKKDQEKKKTAKDISENLRRSGAYLPGIRPGEQTADYIDQVMTRLTVWGSGYLILVCLMPQFLIVSANVPFYLGGTSLLIAVVVVMDFMAQVQSHLMSQQYESLLKKANLKGYGNNPLGGR